MDNSYDYLIAKFGREEDLKKLQNGEIYFNAVPTYRNDGTVYRGIRWRVKFLLTQQK